MDETEVAVETGPVRLPGILGVPDGCRGLVVFAHGSGSSRLSPRNRAVARRLHASGFATLLFDLLTGAEAEDRGNVFDIPLLADRLAGAVAWCRDRPELAGLPVGLFGASTGAAAALVTAADPDVDVRAVVSRGGRPDLAGRALARVKAPTLLIVGGRDLPVLELNRQAAAVMGCPVSVAVVAGAGHLFEEPGALDEVADLADRWFRHHLG